ncbi:MAG: hypothetical protein PF444_02985 [Bacteroidales bacterium]|jgi:lantibiotic modifying enzyme|nr:hypothetical protein [Bacteroidales bacterium]
MNNKYISDMLMLKSSFIKHDGLVHGKMGIAIALAHLSRVENNKLYLRYAEQLIEQFYYSISAHTPTDFEDGLSGIAWGIEYLVKNEFIEAEDIDDVLLEVDKKIKLSFEKSMLANNQSFCNGALGYSYYLQSRTKNTILESKMYNDLQAGLEPMSNSIISKNTYAIGSNDSNFDKHLTEALVCLTSCFISGNNKTTEETLKHVF